jgi:SOS response regulatory protein OraA/RecX
MFINETGISDEIKERIEALKTADKLTNSGFDWEEYKEVATQFDDMEEDDFKVEV